ncbi:UNVERIFIED_CONTAM: hypothetical protein PYX00_006761 [Menopon gallinae]|uniref:Neuroguidin n=1 Tax=Menopon gallinae TaxID=328185 RepID=A0AAW2HWQ1_9NEOP
MVPADEVDDLIQKDLPKAFELLREMNDNAVQVAHLVDEMLDRVKRGELSTAKGLSFLEVKYHMLLSYLINLTYVVLRKCTGEPIEADPAIDRLVELRTVLEKTRPIDQKLKYQVDKLVKAAVTGATSQNDPTNFKAKPGNMLSKLDSDNYSSEEENTSGEESSKKANVEKKGKYIPPKLAAVPYEGDNTLEEREQKQLERAKKRALNSSMIQELKEEYLDTPLDVAHDSTFRMETSKQYKARQEYEENYFTRLPVTKAERHKYRKTTTLGTLGNELTQFGDLTALEPGASVGPNKRKRKHSKGKPKKNMKKKRFV